MDIIKELQNKNNSEAYHLLLQLEKESAESKKMYVYFDEFIGLLKSENSFVRTRGFRLACAQAPWDIEDKLEANIEILLCMLDDDKPITVRQCLAALLQVIKHKPNIIEKILAKLDTLDLFKYQDNMRVLISKDIDKLRKQCNQELAI